MTEYDAYLMGMMGRNVEGGVFLGTVEADSPEKAREKASKQVTEDEARSVFTQTETADVYEEVIRVYPTNYRSGQ